MEHFGDVKSIFKASLKKLERIENIGEVRALSIKSFDNFETAEGEIEFITRYKIQPLFFSDKNYPQRLLKCFDAPVLLYYRGNADINGLKTISVTGPK